MYSYVTKELPTILSEHFPQLDQTRYVCTIFFLMLNICVVELYIYES